MKTRHETSRLDPETVNISTPEQIRGIQRRSSKRPPREERLLWLDREIRERTYPNPDRMEHELGVSRRTAFSDLCHLRDVLGAPVSWHKEENGWHYTEPDFALPLLRLSAPEAIALRRSLLAARAVLGEQDGASLLHLQRRLAQHVPAVLPTRKETVGATFIPALLPDAKLLDDCDRAVRDRHKLHLLYYSPHRNETTERAICPYHLHLYEREWFLLAYCERSQTLKTFLLSRIQDYQLKDEEPGAFTVPPDFDAEAELARAFQLMSSSNDNGPPPVVRIRFDEYQARWIRERQYHPSQQNQDMPDGGLLVTLQSGGLPAIKRWVMSYGIHALVLEPETLRREIAEELRQLQKKYD